jgi:hypothetical protein
MVRDGLLKSVPGRGPGSGVPASAENIAMLLVGLIASANSSESASTALSFAKAVPGGAGSKCRLTGATTFQGALAQILTDEALSKRVNEIRVTMNGGYATIFYDGGSWDLPVEGVKKPAKVTRESEMSVFMGKKAKGPGIRFDIALNAETIRELTKVTIALLADTERS